MKINKEIIKQARKIREVSAKKFGVEVKEISWSKCVGMALRGETVNSFDQNYKEWLKSKGCSVKEGLEIVEEVLDKAISSIDGWEVREIKVKVKDSRGYRIVSFVESAVLNHEETRIYKDLNTLLKQYKEACEYSCETNQLKSINSATSLSNTFRCAE